MTGETLTVSIFLTRCFAAHFDIIMSTYMATKFSLYEMLNDLALQT